MAYNWYPASALTGGAAGALDEIDGALLLDGDRAVVITSSLAYFYVLDDDSAAAESSPNVISPDDNAGDKRWLLAAAYTESNLPDYVEYDSTAADTTPDIHADSKRCFVMADSATIDTSGDNNTDCAIIGGTGGYIEGEGASGCGMFCCNSAYMDNATGAESNVTVGGYDLGILTSTQCAVFGGESNYIENGYNSNIVGGESNQIDSSTTHYDCTITGGYGNYMYDSDNSNIICAGDNNEILDGCARAAVIAGDSNVITTSDEAIIGVGDSNEVTSSQYSGILCGATNTIDTSTHSNISAGVSNEINTANHAGIVAGSTNWIAGAAGFIGAGNYNSVTAQGGVVVGGDYGLAHIQHQESFASGRFLATGDAQRSTLVIYEDTLDGAATVLRIAKDAGIHLVIQASRTWAFNITAVARQVAGGSGTIGDSALWNISGGIKRDGSNNTTIFGTVAGDGTPGANDRDAGAAAWDLTITADDANESLVLTATGEAGKAIDWVAKIELVEVG